MTKRSLLKLLSPRLLPALFAGLLLAGPVVAEEGESYPGAGTDITDRASLQRGAQLFMNYCSGCHSLKYLRYQRMGEDLGLTEDQVQNSLNLHGGKIGEVSVNMGNNDCRVPFAPDYIRKVKARGTVGKKRKTCKC